MLRLLLWTACAATQTQAQTPTAKPAPGFTVVLDAAHGGADIGTTVTPRLLEKNLVLMLSIQLRSALTARGMDVVTTRETDTNPPGDDRAALANHAHANACILLHATAGGSGVHLYTSSLNPAAIHAVRAAPDTGLVPWDTAAAPFVTESLKLTSTLGAALGSANLPYTIGRIRLDPMDSLRCPAVAVEVAPLLQAQGRQSSAALEETAYQKQLVDALAAALVQWRGEQARDAAP